MSTGESQKKLCVYIDGFNLYHAVNELNDNRLKWLNFYSFAKSFTKPGEYLNKVYFFTAVLMWNHEKQVRHKNFIAAQKAVGVKIVEANFKKSRRFCSAQNQFCNNYEEKQTDVSIATTLLADAVEDAVDRAVLVTADSDQIPLVTTMRRLFPAKTITLAAPPGRANMARELGSVVHDRQPITSGRLHAHRLPSNVFDDKGNKVATMPAMYFQNGRVS